MKKLTVILFFFFITMSFMVFPSSNLTANDLDVTSLKAGALSLNVQIPYSENSAFGDKTGSIGGKYMIGDTNGIEMGASIGVLSEKKEYGAEDQIIVGAYGAFIHYFTQNRISPYLKGGGRLGFQGGDYYKDKDQDDLIFGLFGGLGAEYFVTKEFSISAEAMIDFMLSPVVEFRTLTPSLKASFYF